MTGPLRTSLEVVPPFRLDLTVKVLRRLPANPVEVWDGARYLRAFETPRGPVAWAVTQPRRDAALEVELHGPAGEEGPWRRRLARALGTEVDVARFGRRARPFPEVAALARRFRGLKPPRFASLHEAFAGVLLFQQVSLHAAMAILRRLVLGLSRPLEVAGAVLHPFPSARAIAACSEDRLRAFGMSGAKARALREAAAAINSGLLAEAELERLPTDALAERLLELPGVGPWTAALLLLRGFGRLDRFPPGDAAASRLLRELGSAASGAALLERLGDVQGLLYYHLFLSRVARSEAAAGVTQGRGRPRSRRRAAPT